MIYGWWKITSFPEGKSLKQHKTEETQPFENNRLLNLGRFALQMRLDGLLGHRIDDRG